MDSKLFDATVMFVSFLLVIASYLLVVWKDRSWINWATPTIILSIGAKYVFQGFYLWMSTDPGGSSYAYAYCYATYALSFLVGSLVYAYVKPLKLRDAEVSEDFSHLPWLLLLIGFLLYLPILIQFHQYLAEPRRIYELTRTGYGLPFYGSTTFVSLAFVVFLFRKDKSVKSTAAFFSLCMLLAYWHGSKGQIITYALIWMMHRVYVRGIPVRILAASAMAVSIAVLLIGSFALFSSAGDIADTLVSVSDYADYVRNAMLVIDDPHGRIYYGRLMLENEFYSRVPRAILPDKPKDFGPFLLAKIYNPASYRLDEGTGAFDLGVTYADFGPCALLAVCAYSALAAFLMSTLAWKLRRGAGPGVFIAFLYLAGVGIIPISGPFYLPESILLGVIVTWLARFRLLRRIGMRSNR
ncbi:hypothetical protein SAMN05421819_2543 [Bryocella elongata]|uniref:Oligosaccharide repeat unit polymerase n=1 Tax=Bryocella elongata TaxID=863522 RepID=A0A1H5ZBZ9_9BACT|nr:hypothetical protein [Bryocella elongata]SEG33177.1 hypothetical protein SAMN05421819_2543 [Bryocella elongata]